MDEPAASRADAGSADRVGSSELRYTCERMEPRTATLSATATWRAVLVSADPAPARSRGSASITLEVAAGIARPRPEPWTKNSTATIQIGEPSLRNAQPPMATAFISRPATATARAPNRLTREALRGDITNWPAANGTASRPVSSGL
jgi:hypothetical protein